VVTKTTSAGKILDHHDISVQIDVQGLTNCGLFLKTDGEEEMFDSSECPCELLFEEDSSGAPVRQPVGECERLFCLTSCQVILGCWSSESL